MYTINILLVSKTGAIMPSSLSTQTKILYLLPLIIYPLLILPNFTMVNMYPYYYAWDSSLLYATDSLLINGGLTPSHLFHPDIGVLWFEKFFIFPLAKALGLVSISTIQEFQSSLNPYLNFVDFTSFLILLRSSYMYIACSLIYIFIIKLFEEELNTGPFFQRSILFLVSILFSFQHAFFLDFRATSGVRYEYGGFLWWSIALLVLLYAVKKGYKYLIIAMGILAGWAFISKIVLLPSVILLVLFYYTLHSYYNKAEVLDSPFKERKLNLILSSVHLSIVVLSLIFVIIVLITWTLELGTFVRTLKLPHIVILSSLYPLFLVLQTFISYLFFKNSNLYPRLAYYFHRFVLFSGALFIPMLTILFQKKGTHIFSNVYLFSFGFSQISMSIATDYGNSISRISNQTISVLVFALGLLGTSLFYYLRSFKISSKARYLYASIITLSIAILLNSLLLRGNESQLAFYNIFVAISIIIMFLYKFLKSKSLIKLLLTSLILCACIYQSLQIYQFKKNTNNISNGTYYFSPSQWYSSAYEGRAVIYPQTIENVYKNKDNWDIAFYWARNIYNVKGLLRSLQGSPNELQNSSIIYPNSKISLDNEIVSDISPILQNALSIPILNDNSTIYPRVDYDFYVISSKKIDKKQESLELTDLSLETDLHTYFVYKIMANTQINKNNSKIYLLIQDKLAQEFNINLRNKGVDQ